MKLIEHLIKGNTPEKQGPLATGTENIGTRIGGCSQEVAGIEIEGVTFKEIKNPTVAYSLALLLER